MNEKRIRAVIIDDEDSACDILSTLIDRFCPDIEVIGMANDLPSGVEIIKELKPDVTFLDIQMPEYAGYEIINFFQHINFELVFVTAYDNYAVKAFELSAVDYIMKPIEIDKLKITVEKLKERIGSRQFQQNYAALSENLMKRKLKKIVISTTQEEHYLDLSEIIAFEAKESYCTIHLKSKNILVSKNLKHFERILVDTPNFFRTHKSWMININYIQSYSKSKLEIRLNDNLIAKISKLKKNDFEQFLTLN